MNRLASLSLALALPLVGLGQSVNAGSALVEDFENRIKDYVKLQKQIESTLPPLKSTVSSGAISRHEHQLAEKLRHGRKGIAQGNVFTPEIAGEFRRLIVLAMKGSNSTNIQQSLRHAEPVSLVVRVGAGWPSDVPLQSTPPTLLMNLPALPPELDYRVIGNTLVLRDTKANLVVDFIPDAMP